MSLDRFLAKNQKKNNDGENKVAPKIFDPKTEFTKHDIVVDNSSGGNLYKQMLTDLRSTTSPIDKVHILSDYSQKSPLICNILTHAYDPFKKYHLTQRNLKMLDGGIKANDNHFETFITLLDKLDKSEYTGNTALNKVQDFLNKFKKEDAQEFIRILNHDIKANISDKTINKAIPNCIPTFEVALANRYDKTKAYENKQLPFKDTWYSRKLDGVRMLCIKEDNETSCFSREGNEFTQAPEINDSINKMPVNNVAIDGEMVIIDGDGNEYFRLASSLMNTKKEETLEMQRKKIKNINGKTKLLIFDVIPIEDFKSRKGKQIYNEKYPMMEQDDWLITDHTERVKQTKAKSYEELDKEFSNAISKGWEGLILRNGNAVYEGKRTSNMLKMKSFYDKEFEVVGAFSGDRDTKYADMLGGLIIKVENKTIKVGTGFTDEDREELWSSWLNTDNIKRSNNTSSGSKEVEFKLSKIATIAYQREEINPDGTHTLILPSFKGFRDNKI